MIYTLIITSNHLTNGQHALSMAQNLLADGNQINKIYFLFDGAYVANKLIDMPSDEYDLTRAWSAFALEHKINLHVCQASALRRGITKEILSPGFISGSIGELVESCLAADKVLTA